MFKNPHLGNGYTMFNSIHQQLPLQISFSNFSFLSNFSNITHSLISLSTFSFAPPYTQKLVNSLLISRCSTQFGLIQFLSRMRSQPTTISTIDNSFTRSFSQFYLKLRFTQSLSISYFHSDNCNFNHGQSFHNPHISIKIRKNYLICFGHSINSKSKQQYASVETNVPQSLR